MPRRHHQPPAEDGEGNIRGLPHKDITDIIMIQDLYYINLKNSISGDLRGPYQRFSPQNERAIYATYAWNIALCESLYPALQGLEVALRNRIHVVAMAHFQSEDWFRHRLKPQEEQMVSEARHRIDPSGVNSIAPGELACHLSLGFWVNLFKGRYERILWPHLLRRVFPQATRRQSTREPL